MVRIRWRHPDILVNFSWTTWQQLLTLVSLVRSPTRSPLLMTFVSMLDKLARRSRSMTSRLRHAHVEERTLTSCLLTQTLGMTSCLTLSHSKTYLYLYQSHLATNPSDKLFTCPCYLSAVLIVHLGVKPGVDGYNGRELRCAAD